MHHQLIKWKKSRLYKRDSDAALYLWCHAVSQAIDVINLEFHYSGS